jgi:hypothetical protein
VGNAGVNITHKGELLIIFGTSSPKSANDFTKSKSANYDVHTTQHKVSELKNNLQKQFDNEFFTLNL